MRSSMLLLILALQYSSIAGSGVSVNCTFSKDLLFVGTVRDITFCMFTQSIFNSVQWQLAGTETDTEYTGPSTDHSGTGYYLYIDSSNENPGNYARLTSPTFIKPASDSGGCVQFYYHMYGADIGTLNVSVYDNTQSGLVANWQKTGNQGDEWMRADLNLNLPLGQELNMQVAFTAITSGENKDDNKGDIAIDDIVVMTNESCPNIPENTTERQGSETTLTSPLYTSEWNCDFDNSSQQECALTLNGYTVKQDNHTENSSSTINSFLLASATNQEETINNHSVHTAETPHFHIHYSCFKFDYRSTVFYNTSAKLSVSVDIHGIWVQIWNTTGLINTSWTPVSLSLPQNAVKLQLRSELSVSSNSSLELDNLQLTESECEKSNQQVALLLACSFDDSTDEYCSFYQDLNDHFNWSRNSGRTLTEGTGPDSDHTYGTNQGYYLLARSSYGKRYDEARICSGLIDVQVNTSACLRFFYHMHGDQMGNLTVIVQNGDGTTLSRFSKSGNQGETWQQGDIDLTYNTSQIYLVFETKQAYGFYFTTVRGEVAIDDIILTQNTSCQSLRMSRVLTDITVATTSSWTTTTTISNMMTEPSSIQTEEDLSSSNTKEAEETTLLTSSTVTEDNQPISRTALAENKTEASSIATIKPTNHPINNTHSNNVKLEQDEGKDESNNVVHIAAAVGISVILVLLCIALIFMKHRQVLIFKPGSKLSVAFSKTKSDVSQLYDVNDNKEETSSVNIAGLTNPSYEEQKA